MTKLTDDTQEFLRPVFQQQGPDCNCKITVGGRTYCLGWESCTAYAMAMELDATTGGTRRPSGCALRRKTGDVKDGLMLSQVAAAIYDLYGIRVVCHVGSGVLSPSRAARNARAGLKQVLQINTDAMIGTHAQVTPGPVNHAIGLNEVRGGSLDHPDEGLIYDPAADGRERSYHIDQGPTWWDWDLILKACAYLRPNAGGVSDRLGPGKVYAAVFPDSEPHVRLVRGGIKSSPFPDRTRAGESIVRIRNAPFSDAKVLYTVKKGRLLVGYQYVTGDRHEGSTLWMANDDGTEFVHSKNLAHFGGAT